MRIAIISNPSQSTPPYYFSPSEKIISYVTEGLVERGHEVSLYATECSRTNGNLVSFLSEPISSFNGVKELHYAESFNHSFNKDFDIIHNNSWHFSSLGNYCKTPFITTIHNDIQLTDYNRKSLQLLKENKFITISKIQNKYLKSSGVVPYSLIRYSIDSSEYRDIKTQSKDYMVVVGDICYGNGIHIAIDTAKRSGIPLKIVGPTHDWLYRDYFDSLIKPEIDNNLIEYLGDLSYLELQHLLSEAYVVLYPAIEENSFAYILLESMVLGTPVISFNKGDAREIIKHGETGFIAEGIEDIQSKIELVDSLNRNSIRSYVDEHYNKELMLDAYEDLFNRIMKGVN